MTDDRVEGTTTGKGTVAYTLDRLAYNDLLHAAAAQKSTVTYAAGIGRHRHGLQTRASSEGTVADEDNPFGQIQRLETAASVKDIITDRHLHTALGQHD